MDPELLADPKPDILAAPGLYFDGQDSLQLTAWNSLASVAVVLTGRFVHVDGRIEAFSERHVPNTNRTASTAIYARGCGWLTDLSVVVTGATPLRGQTFARVDIVRGSASPVTVLSSVVQGYITATKRLSYPGSPIEDSLAGQGCIRSITGTNPAAGVEISETVPTGARWLLRMLRAQFVTSAAVANRFPALAIDDGSTVYWQSDPAALQAASATLSYNAGAGLARLASVNSEALWGLPVLVPMIAGHRFRTVTANLQGTDDWTAPQYEVEEFLEAA